MKKRLVFEIFLLEFVSFSIAQRVAPGVPPNQYHNVCTNSSIHWSPLIMIDLDGFIDDSVTHAMLPLAYIQND